MKLKAKHSSSDTSPPIPCLGEWFHSVDGQYFDCRYDYAGTFGCEDCIVNDGKIDPRTGRKIRRSDK